MKKVRVLVTSWKVKEGIRTKEYPRDTEMATLMSDHPFFPRFLILYSASTVGFSDVMDSYSPVDDMTSYNTNSRSRSQIGVGAPFGVGSGVHGTNICCQAFPKTRQKNWRGDINTRVGPELDR